MKQLFAVAVPILPGKTEQWVKFSNTLKNEKFNELKASRAALGIRERTFLQHTPNGDFVLVTLEGENPQQAFTKFGEGNDAFTQWFLGEVKDIHGFDLSSPPPAFPELVLDSGELQAERGR